MEGFELVHGSQTDEDEYIIGPTEALPALKMLTVQLVFFGHTHQQADFPSTAWAGFRVWIVFRIRTAKA